MSKLPQGYEERRNEDMTYVLRRGEHESLKEMGLTDLFAIQDMLSSGSRAGRGRIFEVPAPEELPGDALVLKQVLHGGLYGKWNRGGFRGPERLLRELQVTTSARERGVPVPEVAFCAWTNQKPLRLYMATVRVPASLSLADWLRKPASNPRRRQAMFAAAVAVREMHDGGLLHGDLNQRNVMVAETETLPEGFVIDLDNSRLAVLTPGQRAADLTRLLRSYLKIKGRIGRRGQKDALRFLRSYCGDDREMHRRLRARVRRATAWFPLHQFVWRLGWS